MSCQRTITTVLAALAMGLTLGLTACGDDGSGDTSGPPGTHRPAGAPVSTAPSGSDGAGASTELADADVTFVRGMVPHHQQAVTMSDTLLAKDGISARTTALTQQVRAAQQPEIDLMRGWLTDWGTSADEPMDGMGQAMGDGMATDGELEEFERAQGSAAERMYLEMMTRHHQGAIAMARTEISDGKDPDALRLARSIVSSQQGEIDTMTKLLADL